MRHSIAICLIASVASGCACSAPPADTRSEGSPDSAFAAVQARGSSPSGMGVDQATSSHQFDMLPDGGRIELQRLVDDSNGVAQIRRHLHEIADAFTRGDFSTPAFVHMQSVPGTAVLAAKKSLVSYEMRDLSRGGEVGIKTADAEALAAVHAFMAFQRDDHHAGGADVSGNSHAAHEKGPAGSKPR